MSENRLYSARNCIPFGVITNVFLPSYSILFTRPDEVKSLMKVFNLPCDKFDLWHSLVTGIPCLSDCVSVSKSA